MDIDARTAELMAHHKEELARMVAEMEAKQQPEQPAEQPQPDVA